MNAKTSDCGTLNIDAFLHAQLSAVEEASTLAHLEECESCRQRVEEQSAAKAVWSNVTAFLRSDDRDCDLLSNSSVASSASSIVADEAIGSRQHIRQVLQLLNPTDDPQMLGRLGGYEVSGVVGSGGMGVVLKGYDRPLDRTVAIKVMAPYLASSGAARQRFAREARAAAAVLHPNVIAIYGVSSDAELPFLVMPYVGGESLQSRLDKTGPLPVSDILEIGLQIAAGLAAAHDLGLVHRDIKPGNILLERGIDRLYITDFGLARAVDDASVTRTGVIAGTPQYMSPEQARGEFVDARSDLFSLGSVMYAMCTGRVPFRADSPYGILRRIIDDAPRDMREINPDVPTWLCQIVHRLHAKSASDRFESAHEVSSLLSECLAHVRQPTLYPLPPQLVQRRRVWQKVFAAAFIAVSLLVAVAWQMMSPPREDETRVARRNPVGAMVPTANEDSVESIVEPTEPSTPAEDQMPDIRETISANSAPPTVPHDGVIKPWDDPSVDATSWDDQLDGVLQHVEQSLKELEMDR
jgi:serine/threonine protein kinase